MKNILIPFLIMAIVLVGCNQNNVEITEPTNEELIKILPEGNEISTNLMKSLKSELKSAIKKGGFENAIEVCNLKAMPITEKTEKTFNGNIKVKRTTFKLKLTNFLEECQKKKQYYGGKFDSLLLPSLLTH